MDGSMSVAEKRAMGGVWRPQNALEENGGLREIGDFGGAADLSGGREQKILKDGTQERRGRDALGLGLENSEEIGGGVSLVVGVPQAIGLGCGGRDAAKRDARAGFVVDEEQAGSTAERRRPERDSRRLQEPGCAR